MCTTQERIKDNIFYEAYKLHIRGDFQNLEKFNNILKKTVIEEKIGNESKFGEVFRGKILNKKNDKLISIKKIPMNLEDLRIFLKNQHNDRSIIFSSTNIWREIFMLRICNKLVKMKKSIHLPMHYMHVYTSNNLFTKKVAKNGPFLYAYNELADEDLKSWSSESRTHDEWISCFLQIFFGLYVLQYYCGFVHNDLHWGNVLVFKVKKGGSWLYKIRDQDFYIPNEGFLFVLWDFGMTTLFSGIKECGEHPKSCQDFLKILNTPKWIKKYYKDVPVPRTISDLCLFIRSGEYKSMEDMLSKVISKFTTSRKNYVLETFHVGSSCLPVSTTKNSGWHSPV